MDSDSCCPLRKFLDDPFFQDWVLRPDHSHEDFWRDWISENPSSLSQIKEARRILLDINSPAYRLGDAAVQEIWKNIQQDIQPNGPRLIRKSIYRQFGLGWAAVFLAGFIGLALYFFQIRNPQKTTYRTGFGETLTVILPDSSKVILNANSFLAYNADWESRAVREVWVEGEVFFDVKHLETQQTFKVYPASGIEVEVLGTQFNVYQRNKQTKVLLSEGNVTMSFTDSPGKSKILMAPGDLVEYDRQKIQKKRVNPDAYVSWIRKVLQLESTSLAEMIRMGEENYGLKIELAQDVDPNQTASGSMPLEDGESFMKLTARIFTIQVEYRDSTYYIK